MFERCKTCPIFELCMYNKREYDSCSDMIHRYNNGLLLPVEAFNNSVDKLNIEVQK